MGLPHKVKWMKVDGSTSIISTSSLLLPSMEAMDSIQTNKLVIEADMNFHGII